MPATRHFRTWRIAEDADESTVLFVRVSDESWDCEVCQDENQGEFCERCSARRGEWVCPNDGHKNPRGSTDCEECGSERDDG